MIGFMVCDSIDFDAKLEVKVDITNLLTTFAKF